MILIAIRKTDPFVSVVIIGSGNRVCNLQSRVCYIHEHNFQFGLPPVETCKIVHIEVVFEVVMIGKLASNSPPPIRQHHFIHKTCTAYDL